MVVCSKSIMMMRDFSNIENSCTEKIVARGGNTNASSRSMHIKMYIEDMITQ